MDTSLIIILLMSPLFLWISIVGLLLWRGRRKMHLWRTVRRLIFVHLGLISLLLLLLVDVRPIVTTELMTTADKISLDEALKRGGNQPHYIMSLSPDELERYVRSAADLGRLELHCAFEFGPNGEVSLDTAVALPIAGYFNIRTEATGSIFEGTAELQFKRLRAGRVEVPRLLRNLISRLALGMFRDQPLMAKVLDAVEKAEIQHGKLELTVRRKAALKLEISRSLQTPEQAEIAGLAKNCIEVALANWPSTLADATPEANSPQFKHAMRSQFQLAQDLGKGWPAALQNQVAVLALSIILGHTQLSEIAGIGLTDDQRASLEDLSSNVRAYGREDLVKHFWVSAGLTQIASSHVSNVAGVTKEEMDSGNGGSGFSFADLQADRAGVRFSELATQSDQEARRIQFLIAGEWELKDLMPEISGLPEGITEQELADTYGGLHGELYKRYTVEINRRLNGCELLMSTTQRLDK